MKLQLKKISYKSYSSKLVLMLVTACTITLITGASVANAEPDYFAVAKPSSTSQCYGGTWKTVYRWHHWHRYRTQVFVPNWQKLGFSSQGQCIRYVSTPQPLNKQQCKNEWWQLGFNSRSDCFRYLRDHSGGGYGGDGDGNGHHHHH